MIRINSLNGSNMIPLPITTVLLAAHSSIPLNLLPSLNLTIASIHQHAGQILIQAIRICFVHSNGIAFGICNNHLIRLPATTRTIVIFSMELTCQFSLPIIPCITKSYYVKGGFTHLIHMTAAHLW